MLTLKKIQEILEKQFCEPFLSAGFVRTTLHHDPRGDTLSIFIGRREVEIDENGKVVNAGTDLRNETSYQ